MLFNRDDWTLFRNLGTIAQKAGVPPQRLRRLVLKELVDNALDSGGGCTYGKDGDDYWVQDAGPGLQMSAEQIAVLFSINRPLTSSKIIRKPSRGALGNGLRVVVGSIMASGGELVIHTGGQQYAIKCDLATGKSTCSRQIKSDITEGTRIVYTLGKSVPEDEFELSWARRAVVIAEQKKEYKGATSPYWYDSDSFYELLMSAGDTPITKIVDMFEINQSNAKLPDKEPLLASDFDHDTADKLLGKLRGMVLPIQPAKLGLVGWSSRQTGVIEIRPGRGDYSAEIPFVLESFAVVQNENPADDKPEDDDDISVFVNGTPITGNVTIERRGGNKVAIFGCGLKHLIKGVPRRRFNMWLNITTPYMPITTDGKEPNFLYYLDEIAKVTKQATGKLQKKIRSSGAGQRDIIVRNLDAAIAAASGDGVYRYSLRQLFYAVRPYILEDADTKELDYNYFARVITDYEASHGELPKIYRDPRGTLYQPHIKRSTPIGTIAVEQYERPAWTFNKILFCEKEGFFQVLHEIGWPERNDCALLSSKGFASRAVRDVLDLLGETEEEIQFFSIHDADASGTLIHQALTGSTTARAARKVKIINLGLDPWTAVNMQLQVETFSAKKKLPVAEYVKQHDRDNDTNWQDWLQTRRVELNAMTSPQFISWLDEKFSAYTTGKIIPPDAVLTDKFKAELQTQARQALIDRLIKKHNIDQQVDTIVLNTVKSLKKDKLRTRVTKDLAKEPIQQWNMPLSVLATELLKTRLEN